MSQSTETPSSPIDLASEIKLAREASDINALCDLLSSKSARVQQTVLERLGKMNDPKAAFRILNFLSAINITVEGSEDASVNLNLKRLAIAAFESNSRQQLEAVELHDLRAVENYIEQARKTIEEPSTTNTTHSAEAKTPIPSPPTALPPLKSAPAIQPTTPTPSEEPAASTPWSIIVVLIVAGCGLLWLLLKRRS